MKMNVLGLTLLKQLEGCKLTAYKNKGESYYTIGYGHSDKTIKKGQTITQTEANNLLNSDLIKFEGYVTKYACSKFNLNENQFSALVSYTYNRGLKGLKELINNSTKVYDLSDNMVKYWGSNTNYKTALINRRKKEKALFDTPIAGNVSRETLTAPSPTLKRGSHGTKVEALQKCLNTFGYGLVTDGSYGEKTFRAVADFQKVNNLVIDGVYGTHTYNILRGKIYGNQVI